MSIHGLPRDRSAKPPLISTDHFALLLARPKTICSGLLSSYSFFVLPRALFHIFFHANSAPLRLVRWNLSSVPGTSISSRDANLVTDLIQYEWGSQRVGENMTCGLYGCRHSRGTFYDQRYSTHCFCCDIRSVNPKS